MHGSGGAHRIRFKKVSKDGYVIFIDLLIDVRYLFGRWTCILKLCSLTMMEANSSIYKQAHSGQLHGKKGFFGTSESGPFVNSCSIKDLTAYYAINLTCISYIIPV